MAVDRDFDIAGHAERYGIGIVSGDLTEAVVSIVVP